MSDRATDVARRVAPRARAENHRPRLGLRLVDDARLVLRHAWSVRLIVVAFVLTVAEVALPLLDGFLDIPRGLFAALAGLSSAGAFVARLIVQQRISGGIDADQ